MEQQPPEEPLFQTKYFGFWIKVYSDHVEFKSAAGQRSIPLRQLATTEVGMLGQMQITLVTTTGERFFIPTSKKKETQQAIQDAKQRFVEIHPARVIPIDDYLTQMKNRKDSLQLELDGINLQMSTIRAHYQQSRANLLFKESAWNKDHQLKQLQPTKEKLQRQILGLRTEITRVQALKKQGVKSLKMES